MIFLIFFFLPLVPTVPALRSVHCTLIWCCLVLKNDFKNEGVAVWSSKASSMFSSILLRLNQIKTISIFLASPPFIMSCYFVSEAIFPFVVQTQRKPAAAALGRLSLPQAVAWRHLGVDDKPFSCSVHEKLATLHIRLVWAMHCWSCEVPSDWFTLRKSEAVFNFWMSLATQETNYWLAGFMDR